MILKTKSEVKITSKVNVGKQEEKKEEGALRERRKPGSLRPIFEIQ